MLYLLDTVLMFHAFRYVSSRPIISNQPSIPYLAAFSVTFFVLSHKFSLFLGTMILRSVTAMSHREVLCYKRPLCPTDEHNIEKPWKHHRIFALSKYEYNTATHTIEQPFDTQNTFACRTSIHFISYVEP